MRRWSDPTRRPARKRGQARLPSGRVLARSLCLVWLLATIAHGQQTVTDSSGQPYRLIEPNHFEMGARRPETFRFDHSDYNPDGDDGPIHPVIITRPFYIATTEVTVGQFRKFVKEANYKTTAQQSGTGIVGWDPINNERREVQSSFTCDAKFSWLHPGFEQADSHPVVGVSFDDAKAYCRWLSKKEGIQYRLPSEAQWECACRAGRETDFSFGDEYRGVIHQHANVANVELERESPGRVLLQWLVDIGADPEDGHVFTAPAASYQGNPWGLFDMHGNVWEWCEDRYLDTYYKQFDRDGHRQVRSRAIDPVCTDKWNELGDWRVIRGGSWFVSPVQARSGVRCMFERQDAAAYLGFRVVREAPQQLTAAATKRFERSEAALEKVCDVARETWEEHNGHIKFVFRCDQLSRETFDHLSELDYRVELEIHPPGKLTGDLIQQIGRVQKLTGLKLSVGGPEIDATDFAPLAAHPELRWLQITGTADLDDRLLKHFRDAEDLRSIHLQGSEITDAGLAKLPKLTQLETFRVAATKSTGQVLLRFAGSPIREVSFSNLTDQGAEVLSRFQTVQSIDAGNSPLGRAGLDAITSLRKLRSLQLEDCKGLRDDDFQFLSRLPNLDRVDLARTAAGDHAAAAIRDLLQVRDVRIGSEHLTDTGVRALCEIVSIQDLVITEDAAPVTDAGLSDFWRLVNLRSLQIDAPQVRGAGLEVLAELPRLRQLTLGCRDLANQALKDLTALESLQHLTIGSWNTGGPSSVTDAGLMHLAGCERLEKLTLIRRGMKITDNAIERLRKQRPSLEISIR